MVSTPQHSATAVAKLTKRERVLSRSILIEIELALSLGNGIRCTLENGVAERIVPGMTGDAVCTNGVTGQHTP